MAPTLIFPQPYKFGKDWMLIITQNVEQQQIFLQSQSILVTDCVDEMGASTIHKANVSANRVK